MVTGPWLGLGTATGCERKLAVGPFCVTETRRGSDTETPQVNLHDRRRPLVAIRSRRSGASERSRSLDPEASAVGVAQGHDVGRETVAHDHLIVLRVVDRGVTAPGRRNRSSRPGLRSNRVRQVEAPGVVERRVSVLGRVSAKDDQSVADGIVNHGIKAPTGWHLSSGRELGPGGRVQGRHPGVVVPVVTAVSPKRNI